MPRRFIETKIITEFLKSNLYYFGSRTININKVNLKKLIAKFDASILVLVAKTMFNHCRRKSKVYKNMLNILVNIKTTPKENYKSIIWWDVWVVTESINSECDHSDPEVIRTNGVFWLDSLEIALTTLIDNRTLNRHRWISRTY